MSEYLPFDRKRVLIYFVAISLSAIVGSALGVLLAKTLNWAFHS